MLIVKFFGTIAPAHPGGENRYRGFSTSETMVGGCRATA